MELLSWLWIGLFLIFLAIEGMTMALVTIWFAAGALAAWLVQLAGGPMWLQLLVFLASSALMLYFIFPFVRNRLKVGKARTNADALPGRKAVVTEPIGFNKVGKASIDGVIWSAMGEGEFREGDVVVITAIEGNKVIVEKAAEQDNQ